jgi:exopolysaccharide production protein ExoQ
MSHTHRGLVVGWNVLYPDIFSVFNAGGSVRHTACLYYQRNKIPGIIFHGPRIVIWKTSRPQLICEAAGLAILDHQKWHCKMGFLATRNRHLHAVWSRCCIIFLSPAIAAFAPNWMPLILVGGAIIEGYGLVVTKFRVPNSVKISAVLFGAIVLWGWASAFWSISPSVSIVTSAKILALGFCGLVLIVAAANSDGAHRRAIEIAMVLGTAVLAAQISFELLTDGAVTRLLRSSSTGAWQEDIVLLKPGASVLALFAWPAARILWLRVSPIAAILLVAVSVAAIFNISAYSACLALGVGGVIFGWALFSPPLAARSVAFGMVVIVLAAPVLVSSVTPGPWMRALPDRVQYSAYHRVIIWNFTAQSIADKPALGWGLRASRSVPGGNERFDINRDLEYDPPMFDSPATRMALHPHNGALQIWLELGLIGIALSLALLGPIPLRAAQNVKERSRTASQLAMFAVAFTIACLSFGLWQSWWMALLWLAVAQSADFSEFADAPETVLAK